MMEKRRSKGFFDFVRQRGRVWLIVVGVILGVLLLILGSGVGSGESEAAVKECEQESLSDLLSYQKTLEGELETLCDAVAGVSHVEVAVTLGCGTRVVYATDEKGEPATVGSGSAQKALYHTVEPPVVAGVGIVCRGGDNPHVQNALMELVSTTLGIPSNKVFVTGK